MNMEIGIELMRNGTDTFQEPDIILCLKFEEISSLFRMNVEAD